MTSDGVPDLGEGAQIAVIGMAGRFPGSRTLEDYWRNLCAGVESVKFFTDEELLAAGEAPELLSDPAYVRAWPVLEDIDRFDAGFFGMSPRDAAVMDPQHRFFLEVAWSALENAGYDPDRVPATGVFAACGMNTYMMHHLVTNPVVMATVGEWLVRHTGNDMNFLATRVSYQMNLQGPGLNVQTACSSSLVAIHLACQSLLNGECDVALAGASAMSLPQHKGYLFKEGEILSADGHCRPFDARSQGTLFGSGTGCVVLKRLADALADGDNVLAVVRGSAINNDGSQKVGYLAPSVDGQARAVAEAIAISGVDPESISYIEAHGTGTRVGDPIEVAALTQAFRAHTTKKGFIGLASVKGNIGHLGEAAGMAGFIKTVLCLMHQQLPPNVNFEAGNPEIDFENSPFFINTELRAWHGKGAPLRAGITALGAGGTNAHVIVEQAPPLPSARFSNAKGPELLVLSAKTSAALERMTANLATHLEQHPELSLSDVAHTLQFGRKQFAHRRVLTSTTLAEAVSTLRSADAKRLPTQVQSRATLSVVFMFPGGGAQYANMGAELYQTEPVYRSAIEECLAALKRPSKASGLAPDLEAQVRTRLFPAAGNERLASSELERPSLALPALFATEYAMAKLLMSWGVQPVACIGHSMGEYVAAALANVFSAGEGILLVATRGRLFETLPPGAMLSVELPEAELRPLLSAELSIAAVNAPMLCVASGPAAAIEALALSLEAREVGTTRIHISVAAHSQMLAPILAEFEATCRAVHFRAPELPFVSNLTGTWITPEEAVDPRYWVKHLLGTVRFAEGLAELLKSGDRVLVEVGPGRTLASLARQQVPAPVALPTLRHPQEVASDAAFLKLTLGRLWLTGAMLDFALIRGAQVCRRVALPPYPFDPQRYWIEAGQATAQSAKPQALRKRADVAEWFSTPTWKRAATPPAEEQPGPWLVFDDMLGLMEQVTQRLAGERVIHVQPGEMFMKVGEDRYTIRPDAAADYEMLIDDLLLRDLFPQQIVCAWSVSKTARWALPSFAARGKLSELQAALAQGFFRLLFLAQALGAHERRLTLSVVSSGLVQVAGDPPKEPEKALLLGPTRVIPREFPTIRTRNIDVAALGSGPDALAVAADGLLTELRAAPTDSIVALRKSGRWIESFAPLALAPSPKTPVRDGGVYLITGGLGGIGLEVAEHLAKTARAKLVLIGRTGLPERSAWPTLVEQGGAVSRRLERIQAIEAAGGEVLVVGADVTSVSDMRATVELARERFGTINGVIHSAGTIDDGLIALKTKESAAGVLAVKVRGALVLQEVFRGVSLDFVALFSSVSSVLGLEGQVDYTAANAFLDAFAETEAFGSRTQVVSIGWNAWREIGMAVALAEQPRGVEFGVAAPHPCLERVTVDSSEEVRFVTSFSRTKHWLLSEHVARGGEALLPGTGYLELARAGLEFHKQSGFVEITDVTFLSPFVARVGESRELRLRLRRAGPHRGEFTFYGTSENQPHVTGRVEYVERVAPPAVAIRELSERCALRERVFGGFIEQPFMEFGQRWANVERIRYGTGEALITLSLADTFHVDLGDYPLHPALLDMATGGAQGLLEDFDQSRDFFVPFAYGRVTVFAPLTPRVVSHVRHRQSANDIALFDATVYDEAGHVLVEIVNFTMKRVAASASLTTAASERIEPSRTHAQESTRDTAQHSMGSAVRLGISNAEGMDAFDRILSSRMGGHVLASSVNVQDWLLEIEARARPRQAQVSAGAEQDLAESFARPSLSADFVAPRNALERELAAIWRELLGLSEIGIRDDFFELGGQSLVAVRLFNKIRKRWSVSLPLSTLFEAPTIAGCAKVIAEELGAPLEDDPPDAGTDTPSSSVKIAARADQAPVSESPTRAGKKSRWASLVVMQPKGAPPPFFCIAGLGGTLNNLRKLAILTGDERPMYGLQPPGADDPSLLLYTVEELADHYLREVRSVQPKGPYFLGGYSGGGITAFEMCRRLSAQGESIAFLGLIDSYSPELPMRSLSERAQIHFRRLSTRGPRALLDSVGRRVIHERYEIARRVNRGMRRLFPDSFQSEQVQDSWLVAQDRYRPPAWDGKATLFRARELGSMSLWSAVKDDEQHGWGRYLKGGVDVQFCPGDHNTMCEEPNVRVLAAKLREALRQANGSLAPEPSVALESE